MELDEVYEAIRCDNRWDHVRFPGIVLVPGDGNSHDPLAMIVGTAPRARDNLKGHLFSGDEGKILYQLMALAGLSWQWRGKQTGLVVIPGCSEGVPPNAFVTSLVKYRLSGSRDPKGREIALATEALREEWRAIGKPRLIVTLGVAAYAFASTNKTRPLPNPGEWSALPDGRTFVWFQHHPISWMRRDDEFRDLTEKQWEEMGEWIRTSL